MEDLLTNLVGAHWAAVVLQLHTYWMVPVGAVVLYYYGQFHFNTPDYSLTARELGDRHIAAAGGADGSVSIWDLAGQRPLGKLQMPQSGEVWCTDLTEHDGRVICVACSNAGHIRAWDMNGDRPHNFNDYLHPAPVVSVALAALPRKPAIIFADEDGSTFIHDLVTHKRHS